MTYKLPDTIEGLEELQKKMQEFKDSCANALTAAEFVIGMCELEIRKLKSRET